MANGNDVINLFHKSTEAAMARADEGRHAQSCEGSSGKFDASECGAKGLWRSRKHVADQRRHTMALQNAGSAATNIEPSVTWCAAIPHHCATCATRSRRMVREDDFRALLACDVNEPIGDCCSARVEVYYTRPHLSKHSTERTRRVLVRRPIGVRKVRHRRASEAKDWEALMDITGVHIRRYGHSAVKPVRAQRRD